MVGTSPDTSKPSTTIKFLCSYGGKILPRYPDGKLRYQGGETRVLAVHRNISFAELLLKLGEMCGTAVSLRCQLPTEDLDALVSVTSDEDLLNLIEEYDRVASPPSSLKIRAFLSLPKKSSSSKSPSPPPSSSASSSPRSSTTTVAPPCYTATSSSTTPCHPQIPAPVAFPLCFEKSAAKSIPPHAYYAHGNPSHIYLIHNGNYWQ